MKTIEEILSQNDALRVHTLLTARKKPFKMSLAESERQYNVEHHRIFDEKYRPKKTIQVPTGNKDLLTGKMTYKSKRVDRVRIGIPVQKTLVDRATGFLVGNKVNYKMPGPC